MSGYLAYGSAMDHMHAAYGADAFTMEVFGPRKLGRIKLPGGRPVTESARRRRRLQQQAPNVTMLALESASRPQKQCFYEFNPLDAGEYFEVVAAWVVGILDAASAVALGHSAGIAPEALHAAVSRDEMTVHVKEAVDGLGTFLHPPVPPALLVDDVWLGALGVIAGGFVSLMLVGVVRSRLRPAARKTQ